MNTFRVALIAGLLSSASAYATAAIADTPATAPSSRVDAQAQAAALLSRPHTSETVKADTRSPSSSPASAALDAHQSAAALLSGARSKSRVNPVSAVAESSDAQISTDAQAQAAALLSGSRLATSQTKRADSVTRTIGTAR